MDSSFLNGFPLIGAIEKFNLYWSDGKVQPLLASLKKIFVLKGQESAICIEQPKKMSTCPVIKGRTMDGQKTEFCTDISYLKKIKLN